MGSHAAAPASECHLSQERAAVIHNHLSLTEKWGAPIQEAIDQEH